MNNFHIVHCKTHSIHEYSAGHLRKCTHLSFSFMIFFQKDTVYQKEMSAVQEKLFSQ